MTIIKMIKEKKLFLITISLIIIILLSIGIIVYFMSKSESKPEKHAEHQHFDEIVTTTQKIGPFHHVILLKNDDLRIFELPKNLEPIKYDLMIRYIEKTFDGELKIKIKVLEATNIITLNSEELTIRNVTIDINQLEYLHIHQNYIEIVLIEELVKDSEFEIIINYSGNIRNDSRGFYNSSYFDEKNELKIALATQMEPNSARLVVPCFDEPIYKAIWKLTIIHSNETKAFSNAELEDQEDDDGSSGQIVSKFQDSPKMSSYLLAFVISDFACISKNTTKNAIKIRVCSKPEEKDNLNLALDTAIKILDNFETTFGVPYPLGKLDMIEVKEFRSGAMENWGLIIYKEGKLSYNEEMNNLEDKRMIQTVIAHEIAHQWFGNLVTMKNWNQLWLNEGFATLYQLYGADIANSGAYKWDTQFLLNSQKSAFDFEFESLRKPEKFKNHPVSFKLGENDNIREFFDRITYRKAGSILLMIRKVIGTSVFDKAIRSYLNSSQFENVDEDILFKHFQDAYDIEIPGKSWDLAAFAKSWTENVMFPVVRVEEFNETHLEIKQMKLSYDMKTKRKLLTPITNQSWEIPIFYRKDQEENVEFLWLKKNPIIINASQIILNIDSDCYYRVDYNESIWNLISEQLNEDETVYSVKTRFRLLEDAMFFKKHLEIDDYLKNEKEKLPILAYLKKKEKNWKVFDKHRKFRKGWQFIEDNYNKENEKIDQVETTYQIIEIECRFKNCLPDAQKYIDQMKKCAPNVQISKCSKVPGQFRRLVYCIGKAYDEEFRNLVEEWKKVERRASEIRYFNSIKNCQPKTEKSR